ncbi:hypothetical protein LguiB_002180 [Lonicera macranthoides]
MSDYIPQELVLQILSWLPPKSLLRFSVPNCITNTRKLIRHCTISPLSKDVYSVHFDNRSFDLDYAVEIDFPFNNKRYYEIVGSCNGLICLSDDVRGYTNTIILWNPAIRRKLTLPLPQGVLKNLGSYMFVLGFGFDCEADDYKILRLSYRKCGDMVIVPPLVEVYTVKTGAWRSISAPAPQFIIAGYYGRQASVNGFYTVYRRQAYVNGVFTVYTGIGRGISAPTPLFNISGYYGRQAYVNGAAHWVAYPPNYRCTRSLILSFDMCNEIFREIMLPRCLVGESAWYMEVVVIQDSLAVVEYDKSLNMRSVWVMKEYGVVESWTKLYNIDTEVGLGIMLGVRRNGEVLLTTRNEELVDYNMQTGESMNLITNGIKNNFFVDTYKESFALLFEGEKTEI